MGQAKKCVTYLFMKTVECFLKISSPLDFIFVESSTYLNNKDDDQQSFMKKIGKGGPLYTFENTVLKWQRTGLRGSKVKGIGA